MPAEYVDPTVVTNHTGDRIFKLEQIDDKAPESSTGLVDRRLFKGGNRLHAVVDTEHCLWSLKYDDGLIPEALRQRFTTFGRLHKFAEEYFAKRNIKITEITD